MIRKLADAWNQFWFANGSSLPSAVCRIALGSMWTIIFIALGPNWRMFYSADGILSLNEPDLAARQIRDSWSVFVWTEGMIDVEVFWWIGIASTICLAIGFRTRIACLTLFVLVSSMLHRNRYIVNGEDLIVRLFAFYGIFAPWGESLSVDAWLTRRNSSSSVDASVASSPLWAVRMMQIHFCLIYIVSLPYKFAQDLDWLNGDALHWTIASDMWWPRGFLPELTYGAGGVIRKMMTWSTIVVEALFPILVCIPRTKLAAIAAIVALHLGIAVMIPGVTFFTLSMVVGATLFVPAETYQRAGVALAAFVQSHLHNFRSPSGKGTDYVAPINGQ